MAAKKRADPGFTTINVRFPNALVEQLDAHLAKLLEETPGASLKRSDVIRMGVELVTRPEPKPKRASR